MTEIVAGKFITNELSENSWGGTEQMARRMVRDLDPNLLRDFQIIHSRVRELRPDLKKILVCHDLHNDPEVAKLSDPEYRKQFDKIVFVSNWQMQMYNLSLGVPYDQSIVIPNGVEPFEIKKDISQGGTINLIYHTTPHRGLNILYSVFEKIAQIEDIHLDVFSSFGVYGWDERDKPYEALFDKLKAHPKITYHGAQPNDVVREALTKSHIFAYPSIWPETSCIAAIEALMSGNIVVHSNLAALPETCEHGTFMYQYHEDLNAHANIFYSYLNLAIQRIKENRHNFESISYNQAAHYSNIYNWKQTVAPQWNNLLTMLNK